MANGHHKFIIHAKNGMHLQGINQDIQNTIETWDAFQCIWTQQPQESHTDTYTCMPIKVLSAHLFSFDGDEWLLLTDFYSKMPFMQQITCGQWSFTMIIAFSKKLFVGQDILEELCTDNDYNLQAHWLLSSVWSWLLPITHLLLINQKWSTLWNTHWCAAKIQMMMHIKLYLPM